MAVTFDAANQAEGEGTVASVALTVAASSLAIVAVHFNGGPTASNPTFDGQAMTLIHQEGDMYFYRYHGHAAGSRTASVTRSDSGLWWIGVVSVTGFDTSSPVGTFQTGTATTGTTVTTAAITSGSTEWLIVDFALMVEFDDAIAPGSGQTTRNISPSANGSALSFGMSTKPGAASTTTMAWTVTTIQNDSFVIAVPIRPSADTGVTKTPTTANLSLGGLLATHNAFNHVRIRDVLVNESGQPIANAANITLKVWYSGYIAGPADFSRNAQTTDANGTASWSITRGSLVSGQTILYVAQDSLSFSNYTMARMVPNYEA
jgi:hypothetical protein